MAGSYCENDRKTLTKREVVNVSRTAAASGHKRQKNGKFANDFVSEIKNGSKEFDRLRKEGSDHLIEETGKKLRDMMSWMQDSKLVDEKIK